MTKSFIYNRILLKLKIIFFLTVLSFIYGVYNDFSNQIKPIHQWRKADSLSIAYNYYLGESFLNPKTNWINYSGFRNAAAEFPIIYFAVGNIWKLTGKNENIFRLLGIALLFLSIALISEVINYFLKSEIWTVILSCFIYTSPVLISYTHNFIPNPFSFSLLLVSGYFVFKYLTTNKVFFAILFTVSISVALLIKITTLIAVLSFIGAFILFFMFNHKDYWPRYKKQILTISISLSLALLMIYVWYSYAITYNNKYDSFLFSTTTRPYWHLASEQTERYYHGLFNIQLPMLFSPFLLLLFIAFSIYFVINKSISNFFKSFILISFIGIISYFILWFYVFDVHDYYMIELIYFPITLLFILFYYRTQIKKWIFKLIVIPVLAFSFLHTVSYARLSMLQKDIITINSPLINSEAKGNWFWEEYNFRETINKIYIQKKDIQKIIKPTDIVLCVNDPSPNLYLYSLERFGYSRFDFKHKKPFELERYLEKGVSFILQVGDKDYLEDQNKTHLKEVYNKNKVVIYQVIKQ